MAKQSITVELDDETVGYLAMIGKPNEVLAHLAYAAADGVRRPGGPQRDQTNESLRVERDQADAGGAEKREADEDAADEVVRIARQRADHVVQTARDDADRERRPQSTATEASSARARTVLEHERSSADAVLENERAERRRSRADFRAVEREATDKGLIGERAHADMVLVDQREANAQMLNATIRAQELVDEADAAKERAEQNVRERDQFLAMLGHELRNPLSAILMAVELMQEPERDPARQRAIILRQATHLARLVDDLLDVSRVTSGKIALQRVAVELNELVGHSISALDAAAKAKDVRVTFRGSGCRLSVSADPVRLEQVVANLLTNAFKYTPAGGHVQVSLELQGDQAVLVVQDSGVGISAEMLSRIFDLFAQVQGTLDRAQGGMGIGLTLVRSLVQLHGGTVEATSPGDGQGSRFEVRLPLELAAVRNDEPLLPAKCGGHTRQILVIEDNPDSRELLQTLLQQLGHHVDAAEDGPRGVARALELKPEVVLVDIGLPGIDGYAVARQLRSALAGDVFLVALTGYGQPEDQRLALEAGFDLHLTKPLDIEAIKHILASPDLRAAP